MNRLTVAPVAEGNWSTRFAGRRYRVCIYRAYAPGECDAGAAPSLWAGFVESPRFYLGSESASSRRALLVKLARLVAEDGAPAGWHRAYGVGEPAPIITEVAR